MKKSLKVLFVFAIFTIFIGTVAFAGNMADYSVDPDICRFSDYKDDANTLPFIRISGGKAEVDTEVNKSGICISGADLNVLSDMSKVQLLISGSEIKINKKVEHSLVFTPKTVINGNVTGTTVICSTEVSVGKDAVISGDLIILACYVTFDGKSDGNTIIVAENVKIGEDASVSGSIRVTGEDIEVNEKSNITGKIYTKYSGNLSLPNALKEVATVVKEEITSSEDYSTIPVFQIVISSLIVGAIYILIKSKSKIIDSASEKLQGTPAKVILSGIIGLFAIPVIAVFALIISILGLHIVGIPVIVFAIGILIISAILKGVIVSLVITQLMLKTNYAKYFETNLNKFILFTVVLIITTLFGYIPVVGGYIDYLFLVISLGIFITLTALYKTLNKKVD